MPDTRQTLATGMSGTVSSEGAPSGTRRFSPYLLLIFACLASAVPMLYLGATQFVEYDGYWHVFIAQQDNFKAFWWEYMHNDHPLLFYLLLKVLVTVGRAVLLYRAIPILSGLGSVYVVGRIMQKVSSSAVAPPLTALAFGLAMPTVEIAISVRSYMLSTLFIVLSFYYFLDLLPAAEVRGMRKSRCRFAGFAILAVCSHYYAFFYIGGCALLLIGFCAAHRRLPRRMWLAHGLTFLPVIAVMAALYYTHIRFNTTNLNHVSGYLGAAGEPRIKFLLRNLHSLFNLFSPWQIVSRGVFEKIAAGLVIIVIATAALARRHALAPVFLLCIILGELAVAGSFGKYPFGGLLRQQFILFTFLVMTAGICLDRWFAAMRRPRWMWGLAAIAAGGIVAISVSRFEEYPKRSEELFTREMRLFDAAIPAPAAVYVDQFNLIGFFTHYHKWHWHFMRKLPMQTAVDEYALTKGSRHMELLRDKLRWNLDFSEPGLYRDLAEAIRSAKLDSLAVFCVEQIPAPLTPAQQDDFQQKAFALAGTQHLQIRKFIPDGANIYAEFALESQP